MSAAAAQAAPRARPAPKRDPLAGRSVADVRHDADRSTAYTDVYLVPSVSRPGHLHRVCYDWRAARWRCDWHRDDCACACKAMARQAHRRRWWHRLYAPLDAALLAATEAEYRAREREQGLTEDERAAWEVCGELLAGVL